ncbi:Cna B-type domain-containing protein [uncultured Bifidobacterium sp.]|uniref:Cna B-type domain-containing protein n=1 Tax=uncultured Bifidobacterium sp. TaxID=165187 RepID=UPI0026208356|nr:Cna B-type domain-containing protein [uncultured Bifidobacterium sp.]
MVAVHGDRISIHSVWRAAVAALVAVATLFACAVVSAPQAYAVERDLSQYIDKDSTVVSVSKDNGGTWVPYSEDMSVSYNDKIRVSLHWKFPNTIRVKSGDTFTYKLPHGLKLNEGKKYDLYNNGAVDGNFVINGDTLTVTYTKDEGQDVSGFATVDANIDQSADPDGTGGKKSFEFPGYGTLTFNLPATASVSASKSNAKTVPGNPDKFDFIVTVTSKGKTSGVTLDDSMGELLTIDETTPVMVYTDANCTQPYTGTVTVTGNTAGSRAFTTVIDNMNNGQTLYVKYRVNADRDKIYDSTTSDSNDTAGKRTNTVSYSWNGNTNKQTTSNKIDINNTWSVDKTGNYDKSSKTVTWTVVLRPGDSGDISGAKLKDALGKGLESPSGNITMDYYDEEWWNNPDQHKGSVSVPWSQVADGSYAVPSSAAGHKRYVLTYTTKVDNPPSDDQDAKTYDNTFTITPAHPANAKGQSKTGNVTIGNTQPKATVSKQFSSASAQADGRTKLTWKTTVTANRDLTNPQFVDVLSANSNTGTHSFDCSNIGSAFTVSMQGASAPQYTVSSCEAGKVVLDFGSTIPAGATMTITYSTYASADTPKGTTETNTAAFAGISASANYTIPKKEQPTLSKAFVYYPDSNPSAGRLPWSLKVSNIDASAKKVTITDTLPQGLKYVPNSVKLSNCTGQGGDVQQCVADNISVAANGNTLVFTLKNPSIASGNNSVTITYTTTYSDFAAAAKQNTEYVNTAYLTVDGTQYAPVSANVWAQLSSLVSKTADYTEETAPYANYTIDVNPAAIPLNDGNKLELDDTIPDSLALDVTSVKIASESGSDLPGASYTYNPTTRLLTVTVPDSTHAKVTYRARVLLKPGSQMNVDNTAVLRGYSDGGGKGTKSLNGSVYQAKGGTTSDRFTLSIYKYADGDASHALPDAVFGIYQLEVSNGKTTKQTLTDTEITDKNGTVAYGALLPNTVYKISETKAPTGYQTADPLYIVFPDTKDDISKYQNQTVDGHQLIVAATSDGVALQTYSWDCADKETPRSYPLTVSKVDATDSKTKLKGARLQLVRMDNGTEGTVADEWTTDGSNDHEVKLTSSGEYRLKEVSAPQGYDLAAPIDFTVNSDGTIVHNGKSVSAIVMTDTPKTTSVKATKVWNDNNNQDGKRTDATFSLYRKVGDGAESKVSGKDKTVLANATGDALTVQWTGLPQYENGKPVTYSVKESTANTNGYKTTVEGDSSSGYTFTNTYTPQTTAISVHKVWEDSDNQDGIRPNNVHVELYANGVATGRTATITGANNWTVTFSGLPVYDSGKAIAYSVREQAINGYTTKISGTAANGYTITNSHTPQTVTIQGTKTWNDDNNLTGSRPKSITIDLYADGKKVDSRVATASGSWRWDFGEQPACKAGAQITYTVAEEPVPGYTAQIDGYNVTNTVTKHEVKLLKTDESGNPVAGAVMHVATASGTQVGASWTSGSQATPMQLAAGDYQLVEDAAPAGYQLATSPVAFTVNADGTVSVNGAKADSATVTMSDKLDTIDITGAKQWNDNNNHDGLRPDSVTVKLLANGQPATDTAGKQRTAAVTANDNWKFSFTKLPRVDASGKTIAYSVEEQPVAGYTSAVSGNATSGFTITNTHANETVDISGVKQWKNDTEATRPQSVTLQLYANGTPMLGDDGKPVTATASASDNWKYAFTGLPKYNKGTAVNYTVVETSSSASDYVAEAGTADNGYAVTNTYAPGKRSLTVTKQWVDAAGSADSANRPDSISVQLYADGAATGSPVKLDADNGWAYTWTDLDAKKSGKSVVYTVKETQVPDGYTDSTSTSDDGNVVTLTNTARRYAVTIAKTDGDSPLAGAKLQITDVNGVPVSGSFTSGDSATVHNLYPGDYLLTELQAPDGYQIADAIAFNIAADGKVTYTGADGSKKTANNGTLTMVDKSQTTSITGKKVWNDDADQAGKRPSAITVDLLANGKAATKNGKPVTASVSAETGWAFSFDDLPVMANGSAVTYTVKEEQVTGYTADISGDAANGFTITNTIDRHTVKLAKTDENGAALAGATMRLTDPNGVDVVQPWISGGQPYETELADGSYVLTEAQAPAHYDIAESIPFKVSGGKVIIGGEEQDQATVTMRDERSRFQVNIDKVNVAGTRVEGAVLEVTTSDGKTTLAQWTTDGENAHALTLEPGDYRLVETQAPASGMYASIDPINFTVGDDGTLTVTDSDGTRTLGGNTITAVDKYASHKVTVSKKSLTEGIGEIAGAQLEISGVNLDGESVEDQWTSQQGKDHSTELKPGSYTLRETAAPAGYTVADPIDFTVTTGGALEINGERQYGRTLEMVDEPATMPVTLSKVGSDNVSRELAGASLTVTGTTFEGASYKHTWTSKGDGPLVLQLPNGTYTMSETKAPEGYEPADPIDFTVNAGVVTINGQPMSDDTVQMQDTAVSKTAVTAIKQWSDDNNRDGKRAASVKMVLKANGKTATTGNGLVSDADSVRTLSAANNWSTTWSGLTQTDAKGKTIRYTVEEITFDSANYHESTRSVPQSDGVRIYVTNIHQPDTVAISGTKVWNDNDNADGVRPDHIDVVLYGNGSPMVTTAITPDANGNWKWTFEGMPKNDSNGKPIVYTMAEKPVDGYTSSVGGDAKRGFTITNTRSQNTTDITVNKEWNDDDDTAQLRPDAIRVQLYANGRQVGRSVRLTAKDGWVHTWTALPVNIDGQPVVYTVKELGRVEGYAKPDITDTANGGFTITNTIERHTVKLNKADALDNSVRLDGATLAVTTMDGKSVKDADGSDLTWVTDADKPREASLSPGDYLLHEVKAPKGYQLTGDVYFQVKDDGTIDAPTAGSDGVVLISDLKSTVPPVIPPVTPPITPPVTPPTTPPTTPPSTPPTITPPTPGTTTTSTQRQEQRLAQTGTAIILTVVSAALLAMCGTMLMVLRRRREGDATRHGHAQTSRRQA